MTRWLLVLAVVLAGCATNRPVAQGPNGRPMYHIEGVTSASSYAEAAEKCPGGYDILHSRQQGLFFILDIECK